MQKFDLLKFTVIFISRRISKKTSGTSNVILASGTSNVILAYLKAALNYDSSCTKTILLYYYSSL